MKCQTCNCNLTANTALWTDAPITTSNPDGITYHCSAHAPSQARPVGRHRVFNGTPHPINIVEGATFNTTLRKYTGGSITRTIPSDRALNACITTTPAGEIAGIPQFSKVIEGCDPLPEGYDVIITSLLYAQAHHAAHGPHPSVFTIADPVMSTDGRTFIGCRGIQPYLP